LAGREREIPNFSSPGKTTPSSVSTKIDLFERMRKHAVAEELATFQIRSRGSEEPLVDRCPRASPGSRGKK